MASCPDDARMVDGGERGWTLKVFETNVPAAVASYGATVGGEMSNRVTIGYIVTSKVRDRKGRLHKWAVCKRYNEYRSFNERIQGWAKEWQAAEHIRKCRLPPRHFWRSTNKSKKRVEERRAALALYMSRVAVASRHCRELLEEFIMFVSPQCQARGEGISMSLRTSETLAGSPSPYIHSTFLPPNKKHAMPNFIVKVPFGVVDWRTGEIQVRSTRCGHSACARCLTYQAVHQFVFDQGDKIPGNKEVRDLLKELTRLEERNTADRRVSLREIRWKKESERSGNTSPTGSGVSTPRSTPRSSPRASMTARHSYSSEASVSSFEVPPCAAAAVHPPPSPLARFRRSTPQPALPEATFNCRDSTGSQFDIAIHVTTPLAGADLPPFEEGKAGKAAGTTDTQGSKQSEGFASASGDIQADSDLTWATAQSVE